MNCWGPAQAVEHMWFNSMQREEPYLLFDMLGSLQRCGNVPSGNLETGAAWLSSARVVKCWFESRTELATTYPLLPARAGRELKGDCQ